MSKISPPARQFCYVAPGLYPSGIARVITLEDIEGFDVCPVDVCGDSPSMLHLPSMPILAKKGSKYLLVNYENPELKKALACLAKKTTVLAFVLDDNDDLFVAKVRFFTTEVPHFWLSSKAAQAAISHVGQYPDRQLWLNRHYGVKIYPSDATNSSSVCVKSLSDFTGLARATVNKCLSKRSSIDCELETVGKSSAKSIDQESKPESEQEPASTVKIAIGDKKVGGVSQLEGSPSESDAIASESVRVETAPYDEELDQYLDLALEHYEDIQVAADSGKNDSRSSSYDEPPLAKDEIMEAYYVQQNERDFCKNTWNQFAQQKDRPDFDCMVEKLSAKSPKWVDQFFIRIREADEKQESLEVMYQKIVPFFKKPNDKKS